MGDYVGAVIHPRKGEYAEECEQHATGDDRGPSDNLLILFFLSQILGSGIVTIEFSHMYRGATLIIPIVQYRARLDGCACGGDISFLRSFEKLLGSFMRGHRSSVTGCAFQSQFKALINMYNIQMSRATTEFEQLPRVANRLIAKQKIVLMQ